MSYIGQTDCDFSFDLAPCYIQVPSQALSTGIVHVPIVCHWLTMVARGAGRKRAVAPRSPSPT
jgi:hypothetical protein